MPLKKFISDEAFIRTRSGELVPNKIIRIGFWKAIVIIVTAMLGSAGTAFWTGISVASTIPFRVDAMEKEIVQLKEVDKNAMPVTISLEKWKNQEAFNVRIDNKLTAIDSKLDTIRNLIK